jgi:hypothetical protein
VRTRSHTRTTASMGAPAQCYTCTLQAYFHHLQHDVPLPDILMQSGSGGWPRRRRMLCLRLLHFGLPLKQRQIQAPLVLPNALNRKARPFQRNVECYILKDCKCMLCFSITSHNPISQLPVWPGECFKLGSRRRSHIAANGPSEFGMIGYSNGGKRRRLCNDGTWASTSPTNLYSSNLTSRVMAKLWDMNEPTFTNR